VRAHLPATFLQEVQRPREPMIRLDWERLTGQCRPRNQPLVRVHLPATSLQEVQRPPEQMTRLDWGPLRERQPLAVRLEKPPLRRMCRLRAPSRVRTMILLG
jgi:hypothetical protein